MNVQTPTKKANLKMTYKWNSTEVETYAKTLSKIICDDYFSQKGNIIGADILNLTEIKQLNLLIIKVLFEKWQEESTRLKSPYFDFDHHEIKQALDEFMKVLSRYISVNRKNFEPLLKIAVSNTLQLCIKPDLYFESILRNIPDFKLSQDWIDSNKKYLQINKHLLTSLENKLSGQTVFANQAIEWMSEINNQEEPDNSEEILQLFNQISPISFGLSTEKNSFFEDAFQEVRIKASEEEPSLATSIYQKEKPLDVSPTLTPTEKEPLSLNDKLIKSSKTLNEQILKENGSRLSDTHMNSKIHNFKNGVSLNQRFIFINSLFKGDQNAFTKTLEKLESCASNREAKSYLEESIVSLYKWDKTSDEVADFYRLLNRKFS